MIAESKGSGDSASEEAKKREALVMRIAKLCKKQGQFAIACQKYTQLGKKEHAIKCLIKQGDVKAIIAYAMAARISGAFVLAANYLQNTNWHDNEMVMKHIVMFYQKGKAFDKLAGFFEACAQMEIDEYRDYEKALSATNEALNNMKKASVPEPDKAKRVAMLEYKVKVISEFIKARSLQSTNPEEMIKICNFIIESPDAEHALRVGDVIAHCVEHYYRIKDAKMAYEYLQKMAAKKIRMNPYLDQEIVDNIYSAVGVVPQKEAAPQNEGITEEIGEEIEEKDK